MEDIDEQTLGRHVNLANIKAKEEHSRLEEAKEKSNRAYNSVLNRFIFDPKDSTPPYFDQRHAVEILVDLVKKDYEDNLPLLRGYPLSMERSKRIKSLTESIKLAEEAPDYEKALNSSDLAKIQDRNLFRWLSQEVRRLTEGGKLTMSYKRAQELSKAYKKAEDH